MRKPKVKPRAIPHGPLYVLTFAVAWILSFYLAEDHWSRAAKQELLRQQAISACWERNGIPVNSAFERDGLDCAAKQYAPGQPPDITVSSGTAIWFTASDAK